MSRAVYLGASGLLCARGVTPDAVAAALWQSDCATSHRPIGARHFPYYALPLATEDWLQRAEQAIRQVGAQIGSLPAQTPLFIASSSFQIGHFEQQPADQELPAATASFSRKIAEWLGLTGPRYSYNNACISGFSALDAARSLIAAGIFEEALVIGVELSNASTLAGFAAMALLSPTQCRPLDAQRDGLVLGEAVAAVHLTAATQNWRIAGLRCGLDGYSTTGPDPQGGPIAQLAADCLHEAKMAPADIQLIKLQAAGSPGTDLAEARALRQVFGEAMPALISLKPALGHTLGASGIAELTALLACLDAGQLPATANFTESDPEIGLSFPVDRSNCRIERALLNLIGFGGGLASLVIERTA